ncbi:MAG: pyridoxal-phosphate dependent enzyme [Saprospiraceae bacterium]|nr:pyridoxal-phosphate dependent enzyme [Saprospiraceae bacterium]
MLLSLPVSPLTIIQHHPGASRNIRLFIKRDDLLHPDIQGSKARKLAPLLERVKTSHPGGIVTFGGAFSNHLHAVAVAGRLFQIPTTGIIRGSYVDLENPTLKACRENGMQLKPMAKTAYQAAKKEGWKSLKEVFPDTWLLPEGGNTPDGVKACMSISAEIIEQLPPDLNGNPLVVCIPAGTGCTAAGVAAGISESVGETWVFPVSEDDLDLHTILSLLPESLDRVGRIRWIPDYISGGFAKYRGEVMEFTRKFYQQTGILPDPIYTAKMLMGIYDLLGKGAFAEGSTVVALHTGGQQGWDGFAYRYGERAIV